MVRILSLVAFATILISPVVAASHANQPGHFGLGLIVGEPTGISGKYTIDHQFAVQGALGLSLIEKGFWLNADFLIQFPRVITRDGKWPLYLGGGLILQGRNDKGKNKESSAALGLRAVAGVEFLADNRVSFFGEVSVQPFLVPFLDFGVGLGLGARYWF